MTKRAAFRLARQLRDVGDIRVPLVVFKRSKTCWVVATRRISKQAE